MFIGHWSVSLAAAAATRKSPKLATLFIAAQLVDWLFFALLMFALQAVTWFSPTGEEVNAMLSIMGFVAFALPAWAAWWVERSAKTRG